MNCKPGDLAIVIKSYYGNEGVIVEVVSWVGRRLTTEGIADDLWNIKYNGSGVHPITGLKLMASDCALRPLPKMRDETTTDISQPTKECA